MTFTNRFGNFELSSYDGNVYEQNNFKKISLSKPNYWYVIKDMRVDKRYFRKKFLNKQGFDTSNLTEHEIMLNRKIYRIYDCGKVKWELKTN